MSSKKEEKAQAAADRIKAAAMSAAKGLSRAQAERAATAAARNVNAYGQKEEGPSRWQERKEAKRQMYLMSTEKAVRLGERKDIKPSMSSVAGAASQCQKCFQSGHWTYECKNERVYISRPSRSQLLKNPKLRQKMMASYDEDNPGIKEEEVKEKDDKPRKNKKKSKSRRKYKSDTESGSESDGSVSESDSGSSSGSGSGSEESGSSESSSSDSEEERRRRRNKKRKQKRSSRKKRYSSSESSDYESGSDSESEDERRRKSKKHSRRR